MRCADETDSCMLLPPGGEGAAVYCRFPQNYPYHFAKDTV